MPLRLITWMVSAGLHLGLLFAFIGVSTGRALDEGSGGDQFVVEQGIALEGVAKLGEAEEMIETVDIPPVQQVSNPDPVEEVEPELADIVSSTNSEAVDPLVVEEPKPVEEEKPVAVPVEEQAPQIATLIEKSSGAAQEGGDSTIRMAYLGTLRKTLERSKVNPRSRMSGTVMVRFTVGPMGEVLTHEVTQSSGSKLLDDAAIAALERAAPFPPMPEGISGKPLEVQVPFKFVTR